jgi:D-glycero-D-manno-heptose 1,7-bisphosphate phosphatase
MQPFDDLARALPAPLPGTEPRPRGLFVDRWGALLQRTDQGYAARFEPELLAPGALDALFRAGNAGWTVYLIGNEDAVARGRIADGTWKRFEEQLLEHLASYGVRVERNYACLDHPEHGKGRHKRDSVYLLPNTGAMYHAMQHDGIALERSWVIGEASIALVAGWRAGCHVAGIEAGDAAPDAQGEELQVEPEVRAESLAEVLAALLRQEAHAC